MCFIIHGSYAFKSDSHGLKTITEIKAIVKSYQMRYDRALLNSGNYATGYKIDKLYTTTFKPIDTLDYWYAN